jgi:hypothetical protein
VKTKTEGRKVSLNGLRLSCRKCKAEYELEDSDMNSPFLCHDDRGVRGFVCPNCLAFMFCRPPNRVLCVEVR